MGEAAALPSYAHRHLHRVVDHGSGDREGMKMYSVATLLEANTLRVRQSSRSGRCWEPCAFIRRLKYVARRVCASGPVSAIFLAIGRAGASVPDDGRERLDREAGSLKSGRETKRRVTVLERVYLPADAVPSVVTERLTFSRSRIALLRVAKIRLSLSCATLKRRNDVAD